MCVYLLLLLLLLLLFFFVVVVVCVCVFIFLGVGGGGLYSVQLFYSESNVSSYLGFNSENQWKKK